MVTVSIEDIGRDLAGYLGRVEAGETFLIVHHGRPVAEIRPVESREMSLRPFGLCKGQFTVPDDFNDPLPEDILREFEGR